MCKILCSIGFVFALILLVDGNYLLVKVEEPEGINCNMPQNLKLYVFLFGKSHPGINFNPFVIFFQFRDKMVHRV